MTWELIGHKWATDLLAEQVVNQRVRHAYLITGPRGVGRRTLALWLAAALNCTQPTETGYPCGECRSCKRIREMLHPDLAIVEAEREGGTLRVEQMRDLQHGLALSPYEAKYRVAILKRFEEANENAADALLKVLEEPPEKVVLVLTASGVDQLLPTITSRCEVLHLRPVGVPELAAALAKMLEIPAEQAEQLAKISGGRPGYAVRLANQTEEAENRQRWMNDQLDLLVSDRLQRFNYSEKLAKTKDRELAIERLMIWISFWRDVLLRSSGAKVAISNVDFQEQIERLSAKYDMHQVYRFISELEYTVMLLKRNANLKLALDVLLLDLPFLPSNFFD